MFVAEQFLLDEIRPTEAVEATDQNASADRDAQKSEKKRKRKEKKNRTDGGENICAVWFLCC